jgi:hypothetical protein
MSNPLPAARSIFTISRLEKIARETRLVVRKSAKFNPSNFLLSLLKSVCSGHASFNQLAITLARQGAPAISKQALFKRFNTRTVSFLLQLIHDLLTTHCAPVCGPFQKAGFNRLLVEDSSTLRMPKTNARDFPAHGNASGATAGVKCDLCYDLLSQKPVSFGLHGATDQDRTIGKDVLALARAKDLVMRDMGYFDLSEFAYLESIGAFWFTRLPLGVNLVSTEGKPLEDLLENATGSQIELPVLVGAKAHPCRLVAVRADPKTVEKRRRERHQAARRVGKTAPRKALLRDGWHLMLTNIPAEKISVEALAELYRARWAIEIQFRAWKQSTHIEAALNRRSNADHLESLVCASMIVALLGLRQMSIYARKMGLESLSPEKLMDWLVQEITSEEKLECLAKKPPAWKHIKRETRNRQSTIATGIRALS